MLKNFNLANMHSGGYAQNPFTYMDIVGNGQPESITEEIGQQIDQRINYRLLDSKESNRCSKSLT